MGLGITLAENGFLPDFTVKYGIRSLLKQRLLEMDMPNEGDPNAAFAKKLNKANIAENVREANTQHYEVPTRFFEIVLGKHLKYSSCFYEAGAKTLDEAEKAMLQLYKERAMIEDGHTILDLGCGWGSFSLWIAKQCPKSRVVGVSNSRSQRLYILEKAKNEGIKNLEILTADMNELELNTKYDRIVSIEMFEHMRNYERLFTKVSNWLAPDGNLFVHVFSHKTTPYYFEVEGDDNWMGRYFFTGGIMPSHNLYRQYSDLLEIEQDWVVNGTNYGKTALHWLSNMDANEQEIMCLFNETYGKEDAKVWFNRWRIFFMSCAELFSYKKGREWDVSHFRFVKPRLDSKE